MEKRLELVHFQLTRNCNLRCWFCGQWGRHGFFSDASGKEMSLDDWKSVVGTLEKYRKKTGFSPSVMLWGGEPLTCPYFGEIAEYIAERSFKLGVVTNGVLIDRWADVLREKFAKIYVSVDGDEKIHNSIRGEGVFQKVRSNMELLCGTNAKITVMTVISDAVLGILEDLPNILECMHPSELLLQEMIYLTDDEIARYKQWFESSFAAVPTEIDSWRMAPDGDFLRRKSEALARVMEKSYSYPVRYMPHGAPNGRSHCLSPFRHAHIAWNGNVLYCTDFYDFCAGNVHSEELTDVFENSLSEKFREGILNGKCPTCSHCSWINSERFDFR